MTLMILTWFHIYDLVSHSHHQTILQAQGPHLKRQQDNI